jgi:choline dehydrogenase
VVDSQARVFGVKRLRVVDNSVVPFCLPVHPQATMYMLAEKIACRIIASRDKDRA